MSQSEYFGLLHRIEALESALAELKAEIPRPPLSPDENPYRQEAMMRMAEDAPSKGRRAR